MALVGIVANAAALAAMPLLRPEVSLPRASLSAYAVGPHGRVQALAFGALGVACLALLAAVPRALPRCPATRTASFLLAVAGIGMVGLAVVPMGVPQAHTPLGDIHQTAGTVAVDAQIGAPAVILLATRGGSEWAGLRRAGSAIGLVALAAAPTHQLAIWFPTLGVPEGVAIRVVTMAMLVWWTLVVRRLASPGASGTGDLPSARLRRSAAGR